MKKKHNLNENWGNKIVSIVWAQLQNTEKQDGKDVSNHFLWDYLV